MWELEKMVEAGPKKMGKGNTRGRNSTACVSLFFFLKKNDGGLFVTYFKRLKEGKGRKECASDKEKESEVPTITVSSCNIIVP